MEEGKLTEFEEEVICCLRRVCFMIMCVGIQILTLIIVEIASK